jgi:hypothetical protein
LIELATTTRWTRYRRQAKEQGPADGRCGSVSFVQRFDSALNLNPHFHVLMPDCVYVTDQDDTPPIAAARPHPQLEFDMASANSAA